MNLLQDMNALKIMAGGLQDNYPECLGTVYVFNAPWIINGIWSMIKAWLDPVVASKVQFLSKVEQLAEFIDISNIPSYMGGQSDIDFHYIDPEFPAPLNAEQTSQRDRLAADRNALLDQYTDVTRQWAFDIITHKAAEASSKIAPRHSLALKLRENYWELDPFVRGRVQLDREGMLKPGGIVNANAM